MKYKTRDCRNCIYSTPHPYHSGLVICENKSVTMKYESPGTRSFSIATHTCAAKDCKYIKFKYEI